MSEAADRTHPTDVRLGVLIDADNTSGSHAKAILEELATFGLPTVKRAYGDWTTPQLVGWKEALLTHAIQPMQQFANTKGKNSTDSALIIDAMDLLYGGNLDAFALVSSDSDFTRLATRLREAGKLVIGLGRRSTPEALQAACDRFVFLENLGHSDAAELPEVPPLRPMLQSAIDTTSGDDGWANLSAIGSHLQKRHASFDPRSYGHTKLGLLLRAQPYVEVRQQGNVTQVRLGVAKTASSTKTAAKSPAKKAPAKKG